MNGAAGYGNLMEPKHVLIPVSEVELNVSECGSTEDKFLWILIHIDRAGDADRVYHFANKFAAFLFVIFGVLGRLFAKFNDRLDWQGHYRG